MFSQQRCNMLFVPSIIPSDPTRSRFVAPVQLPCMRKRQSMPQSGPERCVGTVGLISSAGTGGLSLGQNFLAFSSGDVYLQAGVAAVVVAMALLAALGPSPVEGGGYKVEPPEGVKRHKTPILMVHGVAHGGWVFRAVADKLAAEGWTVHCLTTRKERFKTIHMYMEEIRDFVDKNIEEPPVLIGHSLGGFLVQHYMLNVDMDQPASKRASGVVFLASYGSDNFVLGLRTILSIVRQNFLGCLWGVLRFNGRYVIGLNPSELQRLMFRPGTTSTNIAGEGEEEMDTYLKRLSPVESGIFTADWLRTVSLQPHRTTPSELKLPALSVIPTEDALIKEWSQQELAAFWNSEVLRVEGQGHCLGDPGWEESYATPFSAWLSKTFE